MDFITLKSSLNNLNKAYSSIKKNKVSKLYREGYLKNTIDSNITLLKKSANEINKSNDFNNVINLITKFEQNKKDFNKSLSYINELAELISDFKPKKHEELNLSFDLNKVNNDLKDEIAADLEELGKCFAAGCFRSSVIICGRLLETTLHRLYYETTGVDILEKSPGIGLGNLVAKLIEREVNFEPGTTQQIHLINQVRIFSVHKKQRPFYPSKEQAYAIILFTLDTMNKIL